MAKILCVLYDDPDRRLSDQLSARRSAAHRALSRRPDACPARARSTSSPAQLLGSVGGELGLRKFLEAAGHQLVVTEDKDGPDSEFERELVDADVVISQPFWPAYLTAERIAKAQEPQAGDHRRHRFGPCRPAGGDRPRHHGRRGDLLQLDQRRRACGDDDPRAGPQLSPVVGSGEGGRLEHRRLRGAVLRHRGDACRHGRGRSDRLGGAAPAEAVRRAPALYRSPPAAARSRGGAGRYLA